MRDVACEGRVEKCASITATHAVHTWCLRHAYTNSVQHAMPGLCYTPVLHPCCCDSPSVHHCGCARSVSCGTQTRGVQPSTAHRGGTT